MTKPHEQEWHYHGESMTVKGPSDVNVALNVEDRDGALISAAPDMARALLNIYRWCEEGRGGTDMPGGYQREVIAALRKAGVTL